MQQQKLPECEVGDDRLPGISSSRKIVTLHIALALDPDHLYYIPRPTRGTNPICLLLLSFTSPHLTVYTTKQEKKWVGGHLSLFLSQLASGHEVEKNTSAPPSPCRRTTWIPSVPGIQKVRIAARPGNIPIVAQVFVGHVPC